MIAKTRTKLTKIGLHSNGLLMSTKEFDAIDDYDECYRYELIFGVLVVTEIAEITEAAGREHLGYMLFDHYERLRENEPRQMTTLPGRFISTKTSRWLVDRVIWVGNKRLCDLAEETPAIAIDFVTRSRRGRTLDYTIRRKEFAEAGVKEYWIIDRFQRNMTVHKLSRKSLPARVISSRENYATNLLPGFVLPLPRILREVQKYAKTNHL